VAVMVAVTDSPEGAHALGAAAEEARRLGTDLIVVNLKLSPVDTSGLPGDVATTVVERQPGLDPGENVLAALEAHAEATERLVIGVRRRSPVAKAVLGSVSQQLLLEADVPVLAVKVPAPA
jgi:nucleotide-binding universal stress UspA family protein